MVLAIVVNVDWFFLSHRLPLAIEARNRGYKVFVITKDTGYFGRIAEFGITPINLDVERSGRNIIKEFKVILELQKIYNDINPNIVHHVTLKISIYGSIAARRAKVSRVVNAISGLGYNFTKARKSLTQIAITSLMYYSFKNKNHHFIFQNPDDLQIFTDLHLLDGNKAVIIKGSGVDLEEYQYTKPQKKDTVKFVLTARMLKDKGVEEFVKAATIVNNDYPNECEWVLVGDIDLENPSSYTANELERLLDSSPVKWIGYQSNILPILVNSDVAVLPSYREGLPKSLIEAAAIGRPIITTDTVGCRECVDDGYNGFLVPLRDHETLAERMTTLLLDADLRNKMGKYSRLKAEKEFSIKNVVSQTFDVYHEG